MWIPFFKKAEEETKEECKKKKLPKIIPRDDVKKILDSCNIKCFTGFRAYVIIHLMYRCGLRVGEVCRLRMEDIFFKTGYIYIQQSKYKKDRVVGIDPQMATLLQQWIEKYVESGYIIMSTNGNPMSESQVRKIAYTYSRRAGVYIQDVDKKKLVNPHCYRHCYATELLEDGYVLPELQELLGHENIRTTSVYTHVRPIALLNKIHQRAPI